MESCTLAKKVRTLNRRGKLINCLNEGINEKQELVSALMVKCGKREEEVLQAYDEFYVKHEDGVISKEDYTNSKGVGFFLLHNNINHCLFAFKPTHQNLNTIWCNEKPKYHFLSQT